jgi:hypothetical protein
MLGCPNMRAVPLQECDDFPRAGFRARRWQRFERDLQAWLATPDGRFAEWCARRALAPHADRGHARQLAQSPVTTTSA